MMEIERKNAERPLRKLRKALKRLSADPNEEQVHELRTQTRRIEALVDAFGLEPKKKSRRVLKAVKPVRKAAGEVRDMDVLVSNALAIASQQQGNGRSNEALARLVEHLGQMRSESARELHHTIAARQKKAQRSLKDYSKLVERQFKDGSEAAGAIPAPTATIAELCGWPTLSPRNIHRFRIRVKQLRYMLQLSSDTDRELLDALDTAKDEIGDWHDWRELAKIASRVLDPKSDAKALRQIEKIETSKLKQALGAANGLRMRYFSTGQHGNGRQTRAGVRS